MVICVMLRKSIVVDQEVCMIVRLESEKKGRNVTAKGRLMSPISDLSSRPNLFSSPSWSMFVLQYDCAGFTKTMTGQITHTRFESFLRVTTSL